MSILNYGSAVTAPTVGTDLGLFFTNNGTRSSTLFTTTSGVLTAGATIVPGSGYSLNGSTAFCEQLATSGNGIGATFKITTVPSVGALAVGANLLFKNDAFNNNITIRVTATGDPITATTTAIAGVSANGTAASFTLTSFNGLIDKCTVVALGTGYIQGEIISFTKTAIEAGFGAGNVTNLPTGGVLKVVLREGDVTGSIQSVEIMEAGTGYAAADTITLQEIGSSSVGTGTITVDSISGGMVASTDQKRYPIGIMFGTPGMTGAAPATTGTIEFKQLDDTQVVIGGITTGKILPFTFKEITGAGTTLVTLADTTIFYK